MIEFDVLPERGTDARCCSPTTTRTPAERTPLTLDEGLDHLGSRAVRGIELDVDLKLPGYEQARARRAARARAAATASLISTQYRVEPRADPRVGAGRAARLVGPQGQARPVPIADDGRRGAGDAAGFAARCSPAAAAAAISAGRVRRADGPLAARDRRGSYRAYEPPAARSTCGRSTSSSQLPSSRRWA